MYDDSVYRRSADGSYSSHRLQDPHLSPKESKHILGFTLLKKVEKCSQAPTIVASVENQPSRLVDQRSGSLARKSVSQSVSIQQLASE